MPEFPIRHYNPGEDLASLARMLTEIELNDRDGEDTSKEALRAALEWPNYRPDQDVWVAESDGKLVGYGVVLEQPSRQSTLYVVVHPAQRRKRLGSQLFELVLARARAIGSKTILIYANEHNSASNMFLKARGLVPVGSSGTMQAPASLAIPAFDIPAGFSLKRYSEVNDTRILLSALNDCYLGMWGHQHDDAPGAEEIQSPRFLKYYNADDILLLFDSKPAVSGICSLKSEGRRDQNHQLSDLLDAPGILKEYRELGYQYTMLLAGLEQLRQRGSRPIVLEFWGDHENVLNIYRTLGFEMVNRYIAYRRDLE